ncbi:efflux RND transporter periplasmic adaptor subunit [Cryomorpha ignava]|uniref:Efflux RND transporter periplasmic adaptor subunit n=1 Tax=Cryomorpha ignava TaxID=101383 RepID=A0A7K3WU12_9FLAO|nr:efflux RND transporter periplasmic adaptor subunit [Cryomorpha ignava]NEN25038.1 efflux RND transporter periplasmic adaptor subunit [Cryomorpha ignava]
MKFFTISHLFFAAALTLVSCSSNNSEPIEIAAESPAESGYTLSENQFQTSGMELGKMEMKEFHEVVKANGMFDVPPKNKASVSSYFGGTVKDIELLPGEHVKKGQTLFILENPDFVQMQQDYLEAKGQLTYLKSDYERQTNLAEDNVTSQKTFLKAESDYAVTKVKVESLGKKLSLMNINPNTLTLENMRSVIAITSPIDAYITKVNIIRGAFLSPAQAAIELVNTDHLHLELSVFEKDLPKVRVGQDILFRIQEDKGQEYKATVHLINKTIDPENRTIGIHGHLVDEKSADQFTPGMYVEATIYATSKSMAALPQNAVVEIDDKSYVLELESSSNNEYVFSQKEVKTGATTSGFIEILNAPDFDSNAEFLTNGAFNLITE